MASGFGRDAGPANRGPGSAALAFGAGASSSPSPAAPPAAAAAPFPSARPLNPLAAPASRFPSPRAQQAASYRPSAAAPVPIPSHSAVARPATAPGASGPVRFSSPRPALDPSDAAATSRNLARHLPRLAAPSISRPVDPVVSSSRTFQSPLSNQHVDSSADHSNGMVQRRLVHYADPLFENGNMQPSEQIRTRSPEFGKRARSPPNITNQFRPPSSLQNYPPVQIADPRGHVYKHNVTPTKFGNQNQSPLHDTRTTSSPLLNSNHLVSGSGRPQPALGSGAFPSLLGDATYYGNSTQSVMDEQEMSEHIRPPQRLSAPFQSRSLDHTISKRSRSPTLSYQDVDGAKVCHDAGTNVRRVIDYTDTLIDDGNVETSKRMRSPSSEFTSMSKLPSAGFGSNSAAQNLRSNSEVQKSNASLPKVENQTKSLIGDAQSTPYQMFRPPDSHGNEHNTPSTSPPRPSLLGASKRTGTSTLDVSHDDHVTPSTELDREQQAKAKRLARFSVELSRPVEVINDSAKLHKGSVDKQKQASSMGSVPIDLSDDTDERTLAGMDSTELAAMVGLCPDMCPEPERAERERKGDLDKYERLGGDRNQTTELLAVKKYNRTAERDADLIRPMPVLQKTMEYLLSLLDHTYDDKLLGLYNFLWDRMRAIRMDLRMQHFFNRESISMLEQMIRLHIIAMHELCEYNKGEGFAEGFDAHLNIEQMNKTSVELFQMYDDHRRKGVFFSTEKEFRVYYALLKLDKHPGYKVEPAELSLDLAKMSPEIRGSPEILFAREVARACRMGNYIAFFRLARKATYLQSCLMHAHFAKLRRQALASLHSGLQNSQGIPISHVVEWLAMEDEDIESLIDYHGFGLRQFEEMYLVKEGPFLNSEIDFPSGCSRLVHSKKSQRIVDDVSSGPVCAPTSRKDTTAPSTGWVASPASKRKLFPPQSDLVIPVNSRREFCLPFSGPVSPLHGRQITPPYSGPVSPKAVNKQFSSAYLSPISPTAGKKESVPVFPCIDSPRAGKQEILSHTVWPIEQAVASPKAESKTKKVVDDFMPEDQDGGLAGFPQGKSDVLWSQANTQHVNTSAETIVSHPLADSISLDYSDTHGEEDEFREHGSGIDLDMNVGSPPNYGANTPLPDNEEYEDHNISNKTADDWLPTVVSPKRKITNERLKIILRKWSQRAADKRFLREQKSALAVAALNSLSLGPPVHQSAVVPKHAAQELDIGHAFEKRHAKQRRSWSHLNVSELSAPILIERNPDVRCICWKLLVLVPPGAMESQTNNFASKWILKKLMGSGMENTGMLFSSGNTSIWTKWISSSNACCLSVVRASDQQAIGNGIANSTSCIIFVVSESIPWELQKARFSNLLTSIPAQSNLPLLILSGNTCNEEGYDYASRNVIDRLGLSGLSEGKISSSLVVFLAGNDTEDHANGFLDDDKLREGLKWLINNLPRQSDVTLVKIRELLLNYLNTSLELLNSRVAPVVGPEHCISVFNDAVNQTAEEILAAAFTNPNQWPALEIDLLERLSSERIFAEMFLPSIGWSLPSRIQPLLATIKSCKLPEFSYDLSWLSQGSYMGRQIQDQKLFLEECLMNYLTRSAQLLNETQAATEVKIMVQKGVGLELSDSYYRLVPRWVTIFRRIYNWRLAKLSTGEFSEAYVLSQHLHQSSAAHPNGAVQGLSFNINTTDEMPNWESYSMTHAVSTGLSLDEIIEINCDLDAIKPLVRPSPSPPPPRLPTMPEEPPSTDINGEVNLMNRFADDKHIPRRAGMGALAPLESDDKLARLLAQCTKLQDGIDERLYIYF